MYGEVLSDLRFHLLFPILTNIKFLAIKSPSLPIFEGGFVVKYIKERSAESLNFLRKIQSIAVISNCSLVIDVGCI